MAVIRAASLPVTLASAFANGLAPGRRAKGRKGRPAASLPDCIEVKKPRLSQERQYVMLYAVSAELIPERAPEFHTRLTDGSIASQRPDGAEIVAAMKRARAAPDGTVRWTETCYCPTPLQHERATVLDRYFTRIETKIIDKPETFDGVPLMDRLAAR